MHKVHPLIFYKQQSMAVIALDAEVIRPKLGLSICKKKQEEISKNENDTLNDL